MKRHQAKVLEKLGLAKAFEELESKTNEIDEKYPERDKLGNFEKWKFADDAISLLGEPRLSSPPA